MKIVLAVDQDKETIVKRTGKCAYFAIYEGDELLQLIPNNHNKNDSHHKHLSDKEHTNEHKKDMEQLKGCDIILVQAVGEHMKEALESIGINIQKIRQKHGSTAKEVIQNFLQGNI